MKRYGKKLLSAAIVMAMTVSMLNGCGKKATPENLLADMQKNTKKIESATANVKLDMNMGADSETISMTMDMDMEMIVESTTSHMKGDIGIKFGSTDMSTEMEMYQVKEDDDIVTYMMIQDQWMKQKTEVPENMLDTEMYDSLQKMAKDFTLADKKVEVNGKKCFELTGKISGDALGSMLNEDMMDSMGMGEMLDEELIEKMEIPCTIDIYDDDILPAKMTLDMKDTLKSMYEDEEENIEISAYSITIEYKEFNNVDKIEVPDEAKDKAEDMDLGLDDSLDYEEEAKTDIEPAKQSGELKDNWESYTVQVNDKVITLPCKLSDLEAAGVKLDSDYTPLDTKVPVGDYEIAYLMDGKENEISAHFVNNTEKEITLEECVIGCISVDDYSLEKGGLTVVFPGGVQMGTAKKDVLSKYGESKDVYEGDSMDIYTWYDGSSYSKNCEIDFDPKTEQVIGMTLQCYE